MGTDEVHRLYLDGQPLDGIKEIELEQAKPDDEPVEPLRTADALTLEDKEVITWQKVRPTESARIVAVIWIRTSAATVRTRN